MQSQNHPYRDLRFTVRCEPDRLEEHRRRELAPTRCGSVRTCDSRAASHEGRSGAGDSLRINQWASAVNVRPQGLAPTPETLVLWRSPVRRSTGISPTNVVGTS